MRLSDSNKCFKCGKPRDETFHLCEIGFGGDFAGVVPFCKEHCPNKGGRQHVCDKWKEHRSDKE